MFFFPLLLISTLYLQTSLTLLPIPMGFWFVHFNLHFILSLHHNNCDASCTIELQSSRLQIERCVASRHYCVPAKFLWRRCLWQIDKWLSLHTGKWHHCFCSHLRWGSRAFECIGLALAFNTWNCTLSWCKRQYARFLQSPSPKQSKTAKVRVLPSKLGVSKNPFIIGT